MTHSYMYKNVYMCKKKCNLMKWSIRKIKMLLSYIEMEIFSHENSNTHTHTYIYQSIT